MIGKKIVAAGLVAMLLFACAPVTETPTTTPSATFILTTTATETSTNTPTPPASITPTITVTPIQFQIGRFSTPGPFDYYFDPSLRNSTGIWEGDFYVCARFYGIKNNYDSFKIAETPNDCINNTILGWVKSAWVLFGAGPFEGFVTVVPPEAKQCGNSVDDDRDGLIDYPSDPDCVDANDDVENEITVPPPTSTRGPRFNISAARSQVTCKKGDTCALRVTIRNAPIGRRLCVYVQPEHQSYWHQFEKNDVQSTEAIHGSVGIGSGANKMKFIIYAVSTFSACTNSGTGEVGSLPPGNTVSTSITRINQ